MKYHDLLTHVSATTGTDDVRTERITRAFLDLLAHRLPNDEAEDLAAQLPEELKDALHPTPGVEDLSREEFLTRFAHLADLSHEQAGSTAKAIWRALEQSVTEGELDDVKATLPKELVMALR